MKKYIFFILLLLSSNLLAKDIVMKPGYRQVQLKSFPSLRSGVMKYIYSEAAASKDQYLKKLSRLQTLMMDTIVNSLQEGRVPMANSIWKKFIRSLQNKEDGININNVLFNIVNKAYLGKRFSLKNRAKFYKVSNDRYQLLNEEKDQFKDALKECKKRDICNITTEDELTRVYDLWKRRTKIFKKEMKQASSDLEGLYDEEDGISRLTLQVSKLFFESAETILTP